jgi:hypothetical protein
MADAVHLGVALAAQVSPSLRCSNGDREKPISAWPQVDLELLDAVIGPGTAAAFSERRLSLTVMVERGPVIGPKHQHGGTAMEHYAAIDVSLEWSSVCVVDAAGQIVREANARSEREALVAFFERSGLRFARIGLEGRAVVAVAGCGAGRGRAAGDLDRDPPRQGGAPGDDREDR